MDSTPGNGLSSAEAARRLQECGPNALPTAQAPSVLANAAAVLREPMFLLLCAAAGLYLLLGDLREALILVASMFVVLGITIIQERRTDRALAALRDLASPRAVVIRDGTQQHVLASEVVPGDVVLVSEGDRVPADARLLATNDLAADESLLTGESLPVEKKLGGGPGESCVFSGTLIVRGQGRATVTATGPRSELGRIGRLLAGQTPEKTALERETAGVVKLVAAGAVTLCVAVVLLYLAAGTAFVDATLAGLTVAMALVPEEFPVVLTVFLALGAWRMSQRAVLTRRMPAIEMLGAATVLCVDKTGTLTENRMALAWAYFDGRWTAAPWQGTEAAPVIEAAALACELDPFDPMEKAILSAADWAAPHARQHRTDWRLERDYPLTNDFLAVCHVWRTPNGTRRVALKGALETVIALCRLTPAEREEILTSAKSVAGLGMRLLGVAAARWQDAGLPSSPTMFEYEWRGAVAFADPLRPTVPAAVAECRRAGVRVVMITGDHPQTATAIARQAGLATEPRVLIGADLQRMSVEDVRKALGDYDVFARVRPEHKLRLVGAYKAAGEVVAMTGDGVNDAPALGAAHIGIAIGRRGSDVSREAAALVLTNDDFSVIVDAIRLGRRIYENIRNAMRYLISVHVPIAGMAVLPPLFGWPVFLFPVHVVFLEFVIDPACSVAFEAEDTQQDAMRRPPRDIHDRLFDLRTVAASAGVGLTLLLAVAATYCYALDAGNTDDEARSGAFAALVFGNIGLLLISRSRTRRLLTTLHDRNSAIWWIVGATLVALVAVLYIPWLQIVFRFAPLDLRHLVMAAAAGFGGVLWLDLLKRPAPPPEH